MDLIEASRPGSARGLLRLPAASRGTLLGWPVDVLFDARLEQVVGFDVRCVDGIQRFLPWLTCTLSPHAIDVPSSLLLLGSGEAEFYRRQGRSLRGLLGSGVASGRPVADVDVDDRGHVLTAHLRPVSHRADPVGVRSPALAAASRPRSA